MIPAVALLAAALATGAPLAALEPSSAIPWLSESLRAPDAPGRPLARPGPAPGGAGEPEIRTSPLGGIALDAVGLLPPDKTGFARTLWGPTEAADARRLILEHRDRGVPEARALFRRVLLAEADPPRGAGDSAALLVARVDRLMALGALEEAEALIEAAGPENPELFRRYFDIGLLLDRAEPACEALRLNATLSPTLPARIFCLARDGDWNAAEITLTLGQEVGEIDAVEAEALARFLDPELFEGTPDPPAPEPLTPLDFLLREAVGLPRPAQALPAAFLHKDLDPWLPMRGRIEAAEALVLNGAVAPAVLFEAYRAGEPAASGGLWERAASVQALDAALEAGDPEAVGPALVAADAALAARGLRPALAGSYVEALAGIEAGTLDARARTSLFEVLLLAGAPEAVLAAPARERAPREAALLAIAGFAAPAWGSPPPDDPVLAAAVAGLRDAGPSDERAAELARLVAEGRQAEAVFGALALLGDGPSTAPPALRAALFGLREAGLAADARRIALETVLLAENGR
jgi:hypothetical protein